MGERLLCKQEVIGSIPFTSTIWHLHHLPPRPRGSCASGACVGLTRGSEKMKRHRSEVRFAPGAGC